MLKHLPKIKCKYNGCTFQRLDAQLVKIHEDEECRKKLLQCEPKEVVATKVWGTVKWFNVKAGYGFITRCAH